MTFSRRVGASGTNCHILDPLVAVKNDLPEIHLEFAGSNLFSGAILI